jgi:LiaI-LiaF-like transmembrane region
MSAGTRAIDAPSLVLGLCLMIVGAVLALDRLHLVEASHVLRFWPIGLIVLGVSIVGQTFGPSRDRTAGEEVRRRPHGGHIIGILLIGAVIANALHGPDAADRSSDTINLLGVLSGDHYVSEAADFHGAEMTSVMGDCTLDLRQARLASGQEVTIDVFALMGALVLRVPDEWTVDVRALPVMGGITDRRAGAVGRANRNRRSAEADDDSSPSVAERPAPPLDGNRPRLVLRGYVVMGGLTIRS